MKNSSEPAFAAGAENWNQMGLTKREMFAMAAMQGILSSLDKNANGGNDTFHVNDGWTEATRIAKDAINCADELLKQLEETK